MEWISAAEGEKYARVITEMDHKLRSFDPAQIRAENRAAGPEIAKRLRRWMTVPNMADLLAEEVVFE